MVLRVTGIFIISDNFTTFQISPNEIPPWPITPPRPSQKFPLIKSLHIFQVSLNTNPFFKRMCFKSSSECKDEHPRKRIIIKKVPFSFSYTFISWFQNFCQNLTTVLFTAWVFVEFLRKHRKHFNVVTQKVL